MHLGDYSTGSTVFFGFTTVNSTGAPTAFSSGAVTAYADASTVQNTTGIVLVSTFDAIVGLNRVTVSMEGTSTFYLPGAHIMAVVSSGAGSEDMTGYIVAQWSVGISVFSTAGLETLSSAGLETLSTVGLETLSSAGLETLSSAGLETLSSAGLETASSLVTLAGLTTAAAIEINTEVLDVMNTDTFGAPTGAPGASVSIVSKLGRLYSGMIQGIEITASGKTFLNAASAVEWNKGLTDNGTVYAETLGTTST